MLSVLFSPDVHSIVVKPMIEIGISSERNQIITRREKGSFRFLHIRDETIQMARHTIRLLACALGGKRSAFLIDVCFADIFQSCGKYVDQNDHEYGVTPQLDWCGLCLFASEVSIKLNYFPKARHSQILSLFVNLALDSCWDNRIHQWSLKYQEI